MIIDDHKRAIGKITSVSADRFDVELHAGTDNFTVAGFDDVYYVARIGSFLMVPVQDEYVVVEVVGLGERDIGGVGHGSSDLNKAVSAKYLKVVPVGMLSQSNNNKDSKFHFGVSTFPSLYADVLYALDGELDQIFETHSPDSEIPPEPTTFHTLNIGKSVVFDGYDVKVQIDEFFGGHTAILGNTGSGKSCTVATILQSLFEKPDEYIARGATFIVFDVNGEYKKALSPSKNAKGIDLHHVTLDGSANEGKFRLPHWFLDQSEWELLLQASERTQIPVLRTALGLAGVFNQHPTEENLEIREHFIAKRIITCGQEMDTATEKLHKINLLLRKYETEKLNPKLLEEYKLYIDYGKVDEIKLAEFLKYLELNFIKNINIPSYNQTPFKFGDLEEYLDFAMLHEETHGNKQIRDYCSPMLTRFKSLQERQEYAFLRHDMKQSESAQSKSKFLIEFLGLIPKPKKPKKFVKKNQIIILDMSAVEDEIVELVSSVLARMIFQLLRKSEPRNCFPVHLVLEEAHRYIAQTPSRYAIDASRIYERIAKEGRKYGLFLLIASQRPSELSQTVLSQCSNFVVHRIQNPDDLSHIRQMTPFISDSVLKRLPSLPKQHALVFGTSVNLPTTFRVRKADPLPRSDDAKIRELWFHEEGHPAQIQIQD